MHVFHKSSSRVWMCELSAWNSIVVEPLKFEAMLLRKGYEGRTPGSAVHP